MKKIKEQKALECKALLESMRRAGQDAWRSHRQDLVLLVQVMVEKILAVELSENRRESQANLLDQAVDMMDAKRRVVIMVHPRDADLLEELLKQAKAGGGGWRTARLRLMKALSPAVCFWSATTAWWTTPSPRARPASAKFWTNSPWRRQADGAWPAKLHLCA